MRVDDLIIFDAHTNYVNTLKNTVLNTIFLNFHNVSFSALESIDWFTGFRSKQNFMCLKDITYK